MGLEQKDWQSKQACQRAGIEAMTIKQVNEEVRVGGQKIPRLDEVLGTYKTVKFFIDPKTDNAVEPTARAIISSGAKERVSVGAFCLNRSKALHNVLDGEGKIPFGFSKKGGIYSQSFRTNFSKNLTSKYFDRNDFATLQLPHVAVTKKVVENAKSAGIAIIVWPSNPRINDNQKYIDKYIDMGVYGIMSDHVHLLKERILAKNPDNHSVQ